MKTEFELTTDIKTLSNLYYVFNKIDFMRGQVSKKLILKTYMHNDEVTQTIKYRFDPLLSTGLGGRLLKAKYDPQYGDGGIANTLGEFMNLLSNLKTNGKNSSNGYLNGVIHTIQCLATNVDEFQWMKQIITQTFKMGISLPSIHKVYGYELVKTHKVQLAMKYNKERAFKLLQETGYMIATTKIDGVRCTINSRGVALKRSGKVIEGIDHILKALNGLPNNSYDGELEYYDETGEMANDEIRRLTSGIANSNKDKSKLRFVIFDIATVNPFDYKNRRKVLENLLGDKIFPLSLVKKHIEVDMSFHNYTAKQMEYKIEFAFNDARERKLEGLILNFNAPYQFGRSDFLMKVKDSLTVDLEVIDYYEGRGEIEGMLGGFVCEINRAGRRGTVRVGNGFTKQQRIDFWLYPEEAVGSIIEVKATEFSKDSTGKPSLSYPVFVEFRTDKEEPSLH